MTFLKDKEYLALDNKVAIEVAGADLGLGWGVHKAAPGDMLEGDVFPHYSSLVVWKWWHLELGPTPMSSCNRERLMEHRNTYKEWRQQKRNQYRKHRQSTVQLTSHIAHVLCLFHLPKLEHTKTSKTQDKSQSKSNDTDNENNNWVIQRSTSSTKGGF